MKHKYPIHKDFRGYTRLTLGNMKITPLKLKIINALGYITRMFYYPKGVSITKETIKSFDSEEIELLIYTPNDIKDNAPCLIYFSGGGFVLRESRYKLKLITKYAKGANCKVILCHYRLAPKYKYPVPLLDAYETLLWVHDNSSKLNIDKNRVAVGGDSAGASIASELTYYTEDMKGPRISYQMLIFPVVTMDNDIKSRSLENAPGWDPKLNDQVKRMYLSEEHALYEKYLYLLSLNGYKNEVDAYIEAEEFDCFHDEDVLYAKKLEKDGVNVTLNDVKGTFHGFDSRNVPITRHVVNNRIEALLKSFNKKA